MANEWDMRADILQIRRMLEKHRRPPCHTKKGKGGFTHAYVERRPAKHQKLRFPAWYVSEELCEVLTQLPHISMQPMHVS